MDGLKCNQSRFVPVAPVAQGEDACKGARMEVRPDLSKLADRLCHHGVNNL